MSDVEISESEHRKLVIELYNELGRNERHFNNLEVRYRFLAAAWALAAFAAIGFVQQIAAASFLGLPKSVVEMAVGFLDAAGVTLIWGLDLRVYHQLLDANFVECLELERKYPWLPKGRAKFFPRRVPGLRVDAEKADILRAIKVFYACAIGLGFGLAMFFGYQSIFGLIGTSPVLATVCGCVGGCAVGAVAALWLFFVWRASRSVPLDNWIAEQKSL